MKTLIVLTLIALTIGMTEIQAQNRMAREDSTVAISMMGRGHGPMMNREGKEDKMMCPFHGKMMNKEMMPQKHSMMLVKMIPHMRDELSLTDDQLKTLIDIQAGCLKQQVAYQSQISKSKVDMQNAADKNLTSDQYKKILNAYYAAKTEYEIAAYDAANKMKNTLNNDQKQKLNSMLKECAENGCMMHKRD